MVTLASTVPVIGGVAVTETVPVSVGEAVGVIVCVPVSVEVTVAVSDDSGESAAVSGPGPLLLVVAARIGTVIAEPMSRGNSKDLIMRIMVLIVTSFIVVVCSFLP
jgi:hypothetical protein